MSDARLLRILAQASAALAAPDADPGVIERLLESVPGQAGLDCTLRLAAGGVVADWDGAPDSTQEAFVDALAGCVSLAVAAHRRGSSELLDPPGFVDQVDRAIAAARWRSTRLALTVFDVDGLALGPGIDESEMVTLVGEAARSVVRQDDVVGHLGAGRFALLLPGAALFEARSAYRRVRQAVAGGELGTGGVGCGAAGFAELDDASGSHLLAVALDRLADARRRSAYIGPVDPMRPLAS